jgi:hypothetical protein
MPEALTPEDLAARPVRVRLSRAKGWRMPPNTVKCDRSTSRGNPFAHRDPAIAVRMFRCWLVGTLRTATIFDCRLAISGPLGHYRRDLRAELPHLRGKNLACWCRLDQPCHADILLEISNG